MAFAEYLHRGYGVGVICFVGGLPCVSITITMKVFSIPEYGAIKRLGIKKDF